MIELSLPNLILFLLPILLDHSLVVAFGLLQHQNVAYFFCIEPQSFIDDLLFGGLKIFRLFGFHRALIRHQLVLCTLNRDFLVSLALRNKSLFLLIFAEPTLQIFEELA